mgnify:CR=1 FL=1
MSSISPKEAVYLFAGNAVSQGFWFSEFERKVKNQSQIGEFKSQVVKAAYVLIGAEGFAQAMVLFNLPVNDQGYIDSGWFLPLRRLAGGGGHGPNMGDGRIRLTCTSQCSISWHKDSMWEPVTSDFMAIRKAIRDNLMGKAPAANANAVDSDYPGNSLANSRASLQNKSAGIGIASALSKRHEDPDVEALKQALKTETQAYRSQLLQLQKEIERQKELTVKAQRRLDAHEVSSELAELKRVHDGEVGTLQQALADEKKLNQELRDQLNQNAVTSL